MEEIEVLSFDNYQKKPVTIQAAQLTEKAWDTLYENTSEMTIRGHKLSLAFADKDNKKQFVVETLEGSMLAELNDMLIIGVKGEIYACKPDIFEQTYNKVHLS